MKKTEKNTLKKKLLVSVTKVLKDNKNELESKTIKAINKAIKQIVKKTRKMPPNKTIKKQ